MTPDDILDNAIRILETDGWHQGNLVDYGDTSKCVTKDDHRYQTWQATHNAPVCAIGAINRAIFGNSNGIITGRPNLGYEELDRLENEACSRLANEIAGGVSTWGGIGTWNDDPSRTKEDVLLAFKRARYGRE